MNLLLSALLFSFCPSVLSEKSPRCGEAMTVAEGSIIGRNLSAPICDWQIKVPDTVILHFNVSLDFPEPECSEEKKCLNGYLQIGVFDWMGRWVIVNTTCGRQNFLLNLGTHSAWIRSVLAVNQSVSGFNLTYTSPQSHHHKNTIIVGLCFGVAMPFIFIAPALFYCQEKKKKNPSYIRKQELREIYRLKQQERDRQIKNMNPVDRKLAFIGKHPASLPPFGKDGVSPGPDSTSSARFFNSLNPRIDYDRQPSIHSNPSYHGDAQSNYGFLGDENNNNLNVGNHGNVFVEGLKVAPREHVESKNNLLGELSTSELYPHHMNATYVDIKMVAQPSPDVLDADTVTITPDKSLGFEPTRYEDMDDTYSGLATPRPPPDQTYLSLHTPFLPPPPPSSRRSRRQNNLVTSQPAEVTSSSPALTSLASFSPAYVSYIRTGMLTPLRVSRESPLVFDKSGKLSAQPLSQSTPDLLAGAGEKPLIKVNDVTLDLERSASTPGLNSISVCETSIRAKYKSPS